MRKVSSWQITSRRGETVITVHLERRGFLDLARHSSCSHEISRSSKKKYIYKYFFFLHSKKYLHIFSFTISFDILNIKARRKLVQKVKSKNAYFPGKYVSALLEKNRVIQNVLWPNLAITHLLTFLFCLFTPSDTLHPTPCFWYTPVLIVTKQSYSKQISI